MDTGAGTESEGFHGLGRLEDLVFAVVDVETSGLDPQTDHLVQIAVVTMTGAGEILESWSTRVRPPGGLFGRVGPTHIHGLSRWSLIGAPSAGSAIAAAAQRLRDRILVGHNLAFDIAFLEAAARRGEVPIETWPRVCTLEWSRRLDPGRTRRHRLGDVCERYGIDLERPHDALADATATAEVLLGLIAEAEIAGIEDLAEHMTTQGPVA